MIVSTESSFSVFSVCILQWPALSVVASNFGIEVQSTHCKAAFRGSLFGIGIAIGFCSGILLADFQSPVHVDVEVPVLVDGSSEK